MMYQITKWQGLLTTIIGVNDDRKVFDFNVWNEDRRTMENLKRKIYLGSNESTGASCSRYIHMKNVNKRVILSHPKNNKTLRTDDMWRLNSVTTMYITQRSDEDQRIVIDRTLIRIVNDVDIRTEGSDWKCWYKYLYWMISKIIRTGFVR